MKLAKDQIARQFSRAAVTYDLAAQLQNEMAERLIDAIPVGATGALVDLGCGTGWALKQLEQTKQFDLTAIDLAPGMIEVARSRVPSVTFHCCDLESTPLSDNLANVVFSNAAIQWCDTSAAIGEMHRICKPTGTVLLSSFGSSTLREVRSAWERAGDTNTRVHQFDSPSLIKSTMQRLGFQNVDVASVERELTFDSVDGLLMSIKRLGATNASSTRQSGLLGTSRYREFRAALEQQLATDGRLKLTFECLFASAQKR